MIFHLVVDADQVLVGLPLGLPLDLFFDYLPRVLPATGRQVLLA